MILVTLSKASGMPYAPSRQALHKQIKTAEEKQNPRPKYFVDDKGKVKIDTQHPEWIQLLNERAKKAGDLLPQAEPEKPETESQIKSKKPSQRKNQKQDSENLDAMSGLISQDSMNRLIGRAQIAQLEEQILKNDGVRYLNEQKKIKLKKEAGELIEFKLAEFLFLGHIEKLTVEILGLCKKIEPMLDNLVKKGDTKGVIELFNRHFENILTEVKKAQSDDLRDWEDGE